VGLYGRMLRQPAGGGELMTLQRLIVTFKPEELIVHALYRSDGRSNPGTKARAREVTELAREGLRNALAALAGGTEVVGTSGYTVREDILSLPRPDEEALSFLGATANTSSRSRKRA
jgi:hypothetical protein